jgi:hypothetical protein
MLFPRLIHQEHLAQVYHCLAQIEAENRDLADVWALLLFKLKLSAHARLAMGTTSMAQLQDVMISSSQRIWDAPDFPVRRDFLVKMG